QILKHFEILKPKISQHADNIDPKNNKADTNVRKNTDCEEGNKICLSNNRYTCVNHHWILMEECRRPAHCTMDYANNNTFCKGGGPCKDGLYLCDGDEIYKCIDGKWTLYEKCEPPDECEFPEPGFLDWLTEPKPKCVDVGRLDGDIAIGGDECEDSQMKCESNAVMECQNGFWEYKEICKNRMQCQMISDVEAKCVEQRIMGRIIPKGSIVK
ncbi:MAG: hypothetical protein J6A01_01220, partial [Proteobacteria bacterium]|nr:hypothetical protein [Pseudomonadota bacterium]